MNSATNKLLTIIAADDQMSKQMDQIAANAEDKLGRVTKAGWAMRSTLGSAFAGLKNIAINAFQTIAHYAKWAFLAALAAAEEFYRRSIKYALELQGSYVALAMVGKSLGIPGAALEAKVQEIRKIGIEWGAATSSLTYWLQAGLPLDKVTAMARAAQDTAKAFGAISTETFAEFIQAIQSGEMERVRKYGMFRPVEQVMRQYAPPQYAKTNVINMPMEIKQQAIMNYLLEKAAIFSGAYVTSQTLAVGLLKSMPRYVYELMTAVGAAALGPLHKVLEWATEFVKKLTEAAQEGRGLARPLLVAVSIVQAIAQSMGTGAAYAAVLNWELDTAFNAERAGTWAESIQKALSSLYALKMVLQAIEYALLGIAQVVMLITSPLGIWSPTFRNMFKTLNDMRKELGKSLKEQFGSTGAAAQAALKGPGVGAAAAKTFEELAKDIGGNFAKMMEALGLNTDGTLKNTTALNAATEKDKTFGGGERFARYGQALGYRMRKQGFAPIQVNVNGSASYRAGAADMARGLGDALGQQLAGQFPTGLAGSGA